jgi:hypothetical protein
MAFREENLRKTAISKVEKNKIKMHVINTYNEYGRALNWFWILAFLYAPFD